MKIVNNSNENEGKGNKKVLIGVCVGVVCLACVALVLTVLVFPKSSGESEKVDVVDTIEAQPLDEVNTPRLETHKGTTTTMKNDENEVPKVSSYVDTDIDEEGLIRLVKETITSAKERLQDALDNGDTGRVRVMLAAIEDARKRNALNETFKPLGDSSNPLREENRDWTFTEAASSLGYILFEENNLERSYMYKSNFCKHLVAQGVYDFDVEKLENFEIDTPNAKFHDMRLEDFEVNFVVSMDYEGTKWAAIVGNVDFSYVVFDIVQEKILNDVIDVIEEIEPEIESSEVESEPEVKNEPNGRPKRDDGNNDSNKDPGYEGEKDGYKYIPGLGYIPRDNTPGGNQNPGVVIDGGMTNEEYEAAGGQYHGY